MTARSHGATSAHDTHDRLLVARYATGDTLAPDEAAAVRSLLALCPGCTDLVNEMRLVVSAASRIPAPPRTRDFRITAEQAAKLRPNALQRFLDRLRTPGATALLRPFAGATLAVGLVLVGAGIVLPRDAAQPAGAPVGDQSAMELTQASPQLSDGGSDSQVGPEAVMFSASADSKASPGNGASRVTNDVRGADPTPIARVADPAASPETALMPAPDAVASPEPERQAAGMAAVQRPAEPVSLSTALVVLGSVLAAVGLLVLALAWFARRSADPQLH